MREHIKILGILNIVLGGLSALGGLVAFVIMGGVAGVIGASAPWSSSDAAVAAPIVAVIGLCIAIFLLCLGLPAIIGGWGLLNFRPWARILVIVLSVFHLFHVPFGTAVGVYGLWVLLGEEGQRAFNAGVTGLPGRYPQASRP